MRRLKILVLAASACVAAITVVSSAPAGNFDKWRMGCVEEEPAVCPTATVGQPYSLTIYLDRDEPSDFDRGADIDCATYRVSSGAFPPGLSISDEGFVRGTPTQAGHYDFYLTVSYHRTPLCPGKTPSDDRFVINVDAGAPKLAVVTASLPDANVNQPYAAPPLTASGPPVSSWSLARGALPSGLTLAPSGVISGTPTDGGLFTFTVQANGAAVSDSRQLSLFVLAPLTTQTLLGKTPPDARLTAKGLVERLLVTGVEAVGGRPPYAYASVGDLPPGITLDPATGRITGTGTTAGEYAFTVTITDSAGGKASVGWDITIRPLLAFAPSVSRPPVGHVGSAYHWRVRTLGATTSRTFVLRGRRPPGLTLDAATGTIAGTPTRKGTYRITIRVVGDSATVAHKSFTIRIR